MYAYCSSAQSVENSSSPAALAKSTANTVHCRMLLLKVLMSQLRHWASRISEKLLCAGAEAQASHSTTLLCGLTPALGVRV
jgi:hypothetical protein